MYISFKLEYVINLSHLVRIDYELVSVMPIMFWPMLR